MVVDRDGWVGGRGAWAAPAAAAASMADFKKLKIVPARDPNPEETAQLCRLAQIELETKRLNVQKRVSQSMLAVTLLLAVLVGGVIVVLAISLQQLRSGIDRIAENIGPEVLQSAVESVQLSLGNTGVATGNLKLLSEDVGEVGQKLVRAANISVALLETSNALATRMLAHPRMQIEFGGQ